MCDRQTLISDFLSASGWGNWQRTPLAGDASARRYERLTRHNRSVILMDAAPRDGQSTTRFADIAKFLRDQGLCPPEILGHDNENGIMIISDLGDDDYAKWLSKKPDDSAELYLAALDVLVHLQDCKPPETLTIMSPDVGAEMIAITAEHYAERPAGDLVTQMKHALQSLAPEADTLALRDFHAENLIWRPHLSGVARVGLLDFQDAFIAPRGYDLASLLRDVRRDVDQGLVEQAIAYYTEKSGLGSSFRSQLACLGAQRNLRILGVFARLATQMNKKRYVDLIPRVWANLERDLAHPALGSLRQAVYDTLPVPDAGLLERLRQ